MLVLSRKSNQEIVIGDNIRLTVLKVKGNQVRIGIDAPDQVRIIRGELKPKPESAAPDTQPPSVKIPKAPKKPQGSLTIRFAGNQTIQLKGKNDDDSNDSSSSPDTVPVTH